MHYRKADRKATQPFSSFLPFEAIQYLVGSQLSHLHNPSHLTNRLNELSVVCLRLSLSSSLQPLPIRSNIFAIDLTNSIYPSRIWCYIILIKCKYYTCIILPSLQIPLQKRARTKLLEMYQMSTILKID